jgi:hypothetical protein
MIQGLLLGLLALAVTMVGFFLLLHAMDSFGTMVLLFLITCFIAAALVFSSAISGFFAGNPRMGIRNGIIFFVVITFLLLLIMNVNPIIPFIITLFLPFLFIVCSAGGWWGGMRCDLVKLYPLPKAATKRE